MNDADQRQDDSLDAATATTALSQEHIPQEDSTALNVSKRRMIPSSRGVANLTPEQLSKKRANDREAQRVVRQRTKGHIETLERRIRELEGEEPFKAMQKLAEERDVALAECDRLRNKLVMIQDLVTGVQPPMPQAQSNLRELAALTVQQNPLPSVDNQQHDAHSSPIERYETPRPQPMLGSPFTEMQSSPASLRVTDTPAYPANTRRYTRWTSSLDRALHSQYTPSNETSPEHRTSPTSARPELSYDMEGRLDLNYVLEPTQTSELTPQSMQEQSPYQSSSPFGRPIHTRLPNNLPPTSPVDSLFLDFMANTQMLLANGRSTEEVLGPDDPSVSALRIGRKDPGSIGSDNEQPLTALIIHIMSNFPGYKGLAEYVASFYVTFLFLRWQICPCQPCYERMPEWLRPGKEQLEVPHHRWVDHVPWKYIRLGLIMNKDIEIRDMFIAYQAKFSVNWPYADDLVFVSITDGRGEELVRLNPVFDSHWRDQKNWSLGSEFKNKFPEFVDESVRIKD